MRFFCGWSYRRHLVKNKRNIIKIKLSTCVDCQGHGWFECDWDGLMSYPVRTGWRSSSGLSQRPGQVTEVHGTSQACVRLQQAHDDGHGSLIAAGAAGARLIHDVSNTDVWLITCRSETVLWTVQKQHWPIGDQITFKTYLKSSC